MQVFGSITYTKLRQIGVGQGMNSEVWLADDPQLGGRVAAKEIEKSRFANPINYFNETQAMFAVAHDNVVRVQYACQNADIISLIMPNYQNGSLADRIQDRPLQLSEAQRIAQAVLAGLAHIHLTGYIHFDVKPSNVLFSDIGRPMVADFGQSRAISPSGVVTVPPLYVNAQPPETINAGVATTVADIYHAGLLMYRALNGNTFFTSQIPSDPAVLRAKISSGKFPDRKRFMPHVPSRLRTLVRKALQVNPADRFQTATEMADALSRVNLALDWSIEPILLGGFRWRASRLGHCDLVVELTNRGATWDIETFTQKTGGPRRAKEKNENWRTGLSLDDAYAHLKDVFERLLQ
jgi:eukaryotic-like serine/threonine-protein kinase